MGDFTDIPERLKAISSTQYKCGMIEPDESEFSSIVFSLLKVAQGNTDELDVIVDHIKKQHQREINHYNLLKSIKADIIRYVEREMNNDRNSREINN